MSPEELVRCVNFQHIADAITPDEAVGLLEKLESIKARRVADLEERGSPAYTTSVGWMGYDDEKLRRLCREALAGGYTHMRVKAGGDPESDLRRCKLIREEIDPDLKMMLDANQAWDVDEAMETMKSLAEVDPWWMEEPTNPDDADRVGCSKPLERHPALLNRLSTEKAQFFKLPASCAPQPVAQHIR